MFFDEKLMNSKTLGTVWRTANNVTTNSDVENENDLSKICIKIDRWVGNDADEVQGRLSLRTSSTLIGGVAKLYKTGVEQLFDDANKLNEDMSRAKKRCSPSTGSPKSTATSNTVDTPDEMRRLGDLQMATSITPQKKRRTNVVSPKMAPVAHTMDRSSSEASSTVGLSETNCSSGFSGFNINTSLEKLENTEYTIPKTKNQGTQTSPALTRGEGNLSSEDFNPDLPFGYTIIYDSFRSRIPSRIIFSSLNTDINLLV